MYRNWFKPIFDFTVSLIVLTISLPILVLAMIAVKWSTRGPIFFVHQRPGKGEKPIRVIKLCTMNNKKDASGNLLPNKQRVTKVGAFMRKYSLDEIPQLINVIKGDLSLVGPRPLEMRYLSLYTNVENRRHEVKPGITGWAQINGRNAIDWKRKFELDVWYVNNQSFIIDMKILLLTVKKVIISEGVNVNQSLTVEPFDVYLKKKNNDF